MIFCTLFVDIFDHNSIKGGNTHFSAKSIETFVTFHVCSLSSFRYSRESFGSIAGFLCTFDDNDMKIKRRIFPNANKF